MTVKKMPLTQERLKEILHYDPVTGDFTWKISTGPRAVVGEIAGTPLEGYVSIGLLGKVYLAHRLAWFYMTGEQPPEVDHKDTVRNHNAFDNLRPSTRSQNIQNVKIRADNTSGFKGVTPKGNKWQARLTFGGKRHQLGTYNTPEEADAVVRAKREEVHGEFARFE
jgi:hypothetical protein